MARLQILQLPEGDSDERPPFLLVVDQVPTDEAKFDAIRRDLLADGDLAPRLGARAVLVFEDTIDIPANELTPLTASTDEGDEEVRRLAEDRDELHVELGLAHGQLHSAALSAIRGKHANIRELIERAEQAEAERDEAQQWARHGYEIGQKHCGWSDHGVAPDWLTEGWPPHIDSCEHLKQAAEYDETITRVRNVPTKPEIMNAQQEHPSVWMHGYHCGVLAAKSALRSPREPAKCDDA
ncbi:hypothetical protein ACGFZR_15075 [Streptomyces sp. NPDC048241]|uniref:hypothetical protein n=1 Tax=Streptomyces sp. NPDC048241 TaxID=3365521 RepID=UPI00371F4A81